MGCEHTVGKLIQASSFATAWEIIRRARDDAARQKMQSALEEHRQAMQHMQELNAIVGHGRGIPLLNAGQATPSMTSDAQAAVPSESSVAFDNLKGFVRPYGAYEHEHHVVLNAIMQVLGNLPLGPAATPADALAFVIFFGFTYTIMCNTNELPDFGETRHEVLTHAAHFVLLQEEGASKIGQSIAKQPEQLRLLASFLKLVCFQMEPSAIVTDMASTIAISICCNHPSEELKSSPVFKPLEQLLRYVLAARTCTKESKNDKNSSIITLLSDGRLMADGAVYTFVGFSQGGLVLSTSVDNSDTTAKDVNNEDVQKYGIDFNFPFVTVASASKPEPQNVCAACQIPMVHYENFERLSTVRSALVTADLWTMSEVNVSENGVARFRASGMIWDARLGRTVRMQGLDFEADAFQLHALRPLVHERLSALVPYAGSPRRSPEGFPFPPCSDVRATGIRVIELLRRASDYDVDRSGRVTSLTIARETLFATKDGKGRLEWSRKAANHAFALGDVV